MKRTLFLRWALIFCLTIVASVIAFQLDSFSSINKLDATKICFVIIAIFWTMSIYCGVLTWQASSIIELGDKTTKLARIENQADHGWFAKNLCEQLGFLGTIIGMLMVLIGGFQNIDNAEPDSVKKMLGHLSSGLATAFVTTLVGYVGSILLSLQYHNLSNAIDGEKSEQK